MAEPTATDFAAVAARDAQELNGIIQADVSKGATVHVFDPNASPQAKAASAGQGIEKSTTGTGNSGGKGVTSARCATRS
jgi:hypothetical protein